MTSEERERPFELELAGEKLWVTLDKLGVRFLFYQMDSALLLEHYGEWLREIDLNRAPLIHEGRTLILEEDVVEALRARIILAELSHFWGHKLPMKIHDRVLGSPNSIRFVLSACRYMLNGTAEESSSLTAHLLGVPLDEVQSLIDYDELMMRR